MENTLECLLRLPRRVGEFVADKRTDWAFRWIRLGPRFIQHLRPSAPRSLGVLNPQPGLMTVLAKYQAHPLDQGTQSWLG